MVRPRGKHSRASCGQHSQLTIEDNAHDRRVHPQGRRDRSGALGVDAVSTLHAATRKRAEIIREHLTQRVRGMGSFRALLTSQVHARDRCVRNQRPCNIGRAF